MKKNNVSNPCRTRCEKNRHNSTGLAKPGVLRWCFGRDTMKPRNIVNIGPLFWAYVTQTPCAAQRISHGEFSSDSNDCRVNAIPKIRFTLLSRSGSFLKNRYNVVNNTVYIPPFPYGICIYIYKLAIHLFPFTASLYCRCHTRANSFITRTGYVFETCIQKCVVKARIARACTRARHVVLTHS